MNKMTNKNLEQYMQGIEENVDSPIFDSLIETERGYAGARNSLDNGKDVKRLAINTSLEVDSNILESIIEQPWLIPAYWQTRKNQGITQQEDGEKGILHQVPNEFFPRIALLAYSTAEMPEDFRKEFLEDYIGENHANDLGEISGYVGTSRAVGRKFNPLGYELGKNVWTEKIIPAFIRGEKLYESVGEFRKMINASNDQELIEKANKYGKDLCPAMGNGAAMIMMAEGWQLKELVNKEMVSQD